MKRKEKTILTIFFIIYLILNFIFLLKHELWRDEVHAWLLAKNFGVFELFKISRYDGHPILWHILLMPFAKLNFPVYTISVINFIIVSISVYLYLFKTKINYIFKTITLFTIPFLFVYPVIARNYCLSLLFIILIAIMYEKRKEKPLIYSILISLLLNTPTMSWGLVLGLVITFHIDEIIKRIKGNSDIKKFKDLIIGFIIIIFNWLLLIFQLFATKNKDFITLANTNQSITNSTIRHILIVAIIMITFTLCVLIIKKGYRQLIILLCSLGVQIIIYAFFYSSVLEQRLLLTCVYVLFFILIYNNKYIKIYYILFILLFLYHTKNVYTFIKNDYYFNYSSGYEIAEYINKNIPNEKILVEDSVYCQSFYPLIKNEIYDINYEMDVNKIKYMSEYDVKLDLYLKYDKYKNNYIVLTDESNIDNLELIYKTDGSIMNENYYLYYIK